MSKIKEQQLEIFKQDVSKLLLGEINNINNDCLSIGDVEQYLNELGINLDNYDSNGWQHDYWNSWDINEIKYTLAGSGYYGGISFSKDTD